VDVAVTPLPDSLALASTTPTDTVIFTGVDTASAANFSANLTASVLATGTAPPSPVPAVIVRYTILYAPAPVGNGVSGLLVNSANHPAAEDTTDASGQTSLRIRVRPSAPASHPDSFVVSASASYRGVKLRGSPVVFVIPIRNVLLAASRAP
jgi:hypothetical protein